MASTCAFSVFIGAVKLTSLACGNQHVWACDSRGGVYFRVGTQPLNPSLMLPAWIAIEPPVQVSRGCLIPAPQLAGEVLSWGEATPVGEGLPVNRAEARIRAPGAECARGLHTLIPLVFQLGVWYLWSLGLNRFMII